MEQQQRIVRQTVAYRPTNQIFLQKEKNYIQQYSHLYLKRLLALRPALKRFLQDQQRSGHFSIADKVIALKIGEKVGVVGTVYKEQKLKPNVLDEFTNDFSAIPADRRENYTSDDDMLLLEDESGRCALVGGGDSEQWKETVAHLVTGVVIGCIGRLNDAGVLVVERVVYPGDTLPASLPARAVDENREDRQQKRFLILASGIYAGSVTDNNNIYLDLLLDYIAGHLDPAIGSSFARLIIAGGAICPPPARDAFKDSTTIDAKLTVETQEALVESLRAADRFFGELAACVPIDVMPGEHDPCNTSMPQQPMHPCLFPIASRLNQSFRCATNPHSFVLGEDVQVIGHSGQPVSDALMSMKPGTKAIDVLDWTINRFRHLAPTAPDTLSCYPFYDRDPFVLEKDSCRLAFSGGCKSFETKVSRGTRLVCVPSFRETHQVVVVDLDAPDLAASVVSFDINV